MVSVWLNDNRKVDIPLGWHEVTTELYQRLKEIEEPDIFKVFAVLINVEPEQLLQSKSEELEFTMYKVSEFIFYDEYFRNNPVPTEWKINHKTITIPQKIDAMTIQQNLMVRQKLTQIKFLEQGISYATAVYLQPFIDEGRFDSDRVPEIEKELLKMPIEDTFPIGFFLLNRLRNFGNDGRMLLLQTRVSLMSSVSRYRRWRNSAS